MASWNSFFYSDIIYYFRSLKSQKKDDFIILKEKISEYNPHTEHLSTTEKIYSNLIKFARINSEEELFDKIVPIIQEINIEDKESWPNDFTITINELNKIVKHINEANEKDKKMRYGFNRPLLFGLVAIMVSILILPFGWIVTPVAIDFPSNSFKMAFVGSIIYLALLSIFQIIFLLDEILGLEFADRIIGKE